MTPALPATAASNNNKDLVIIRPTEAQLRYSQFHLQRRSQAVKTWIEQLYQTPLEHAGQHQHSSGRSSAASAAAPEHNDNDSDYCYNSSDTETSAVRDIRRKCRPQISTGRRALLQLSRKGYRKRRKAILIHGYRGFVKVAVDDNLDENIGVRREISGDNGMSAHETNVDRTRDDLEEEDVMDAPELEEIFMTRPKHSRPQPRIQNQKESESFKRFQAACHAMMMNIKMSHVTAPVVAAPTRRWKRSEQHIKAAEELQHSDFLDYKWGVRKKRQNSSRSTTLLLSAYYYQNHQMMDRGASWMMHAPKHVQYNRDTPYFHDLTQLPGGSTVSGGSGSDFTSSTLVMRTPGPKKFNQLVAFVQQRLIEKEKEAAAQRNASVKASGEAAPPKMRLRDSHLKNSSEEEHRARRISRAREIAESFEPKPHGEEANRIRRMAQNLEGGNKTPTMRLRTELEFGSIETGGNSNKHSQGSQQRRARYVPRMRLREFTTLSKDYPVVEEDPLQSSPRRRLVQKFDQAEENPVEAKLEDTGFVSPPRTTLRDFETEEDIIIKDSPKMSRNKEMTPALEGNRSETDSQKTIKEMAQSLEPDRKPKKQFRHDLGYEMDEKKISEDNEATPSRKMVRGLSEQFESANASMQQVAASPTPERLSASELDNFAEALSRTEGKDYEKQARPTTSASTAYDFLARNSHDNDDKTEQQPHRNPPKGYSIQHHVLEISSPGRESEAVSDLSRESDMPSLSALWHRGRDGINALTSSLNTIAETHADKVPPELKERASDVTGRVSGFFNKFRSQGKEDQTSAKEELSGTDLSLQSDKDRTEVEERSQGEYLLSAKLLHSQSEDSHEALAAYRKKRETLSSDDEKTSEASSYHALSAQIREVVQNSKASPALVSNDNKRFISPTTTAQTQSTANNTTRSDFLIEKDREAHGRILHSSTLFGELEQDSIIDTDDVVSEKNGIDPHKLASLMMSPDVLQKRLKQAIYAVEQRKWEQVLYLINANPWLAEMKELTTNQYLLHKLAFFGGGSSPAPETLCERLIEKFPSAVYKFDQDGNVPLHLAAAAGYLPMIEMLGERFEGGASIRNEDGMLPLHFTIASLADFVSNSHSSEVEDSDMQSLSLKIVKTVLRLFPKAVAIADNVGNLPLHVAAECLGGGIGVDVVYLLMDEADRQLADPFGARFHNKVKLEEFVLEDVSIATMSTDKETEASVLDSEIQCSMVLNDYNETPLLSAVRSTKGWEIIEAMVTGPGGRTAALYQDADKNNALHLLVGEFHDATAALSILKVVPDAASVRNAKGMLPIELACMQLAPEEVILAIALVDLPFDIDDQSGVIVHEGRGGSWCFLTCESDDHMVEIVQEVVSICSFQQLRELCFMVDAISGNVVIDRATPKCREVLSQSLRFMGRFEFVGNGPLLSNPDTGFKVFEALDFGGHENEEGKRVLLECYDSQDSFEKRVQTLLSMELDEAFVEEVKVYVEDMVDPFNGSDEATHQRCVSIERPQVTLDKVVVGMKNGGHRTNLDLRMKYAAKVCSVLRLIGKALRHLHSSGIVHGNVCMETCGKFVESWKLSERLDVQVSGETFDPSRFRQTFPPESLKLSEQEGMIYDSDNAPVSFLKTLMAHPSIDIWAFGQICYESLVGKPLVEFDRNKSPSEDVAALLQIMEWNESNMQAVFSDLLDSGIEESGADMITSCLFPNPQDRPSSMAEILDHKFWMDMRKYRSKKNRLGRDRVESSKSVPTD